MFGGYLIADRPVHLDRQHDRHSAGRVPGLPHAEHQPDQPAVTRSSSDSQDNFAWSVFANLGYEFSDQFRVDGSLRYDHDKRENTTLTPDRVPAQRPRLPGRAPPARCARSELRRLAAQAHADLHAERRRDALRRLFARLPQRAGSTRPGSAWSPRPTASSASATSSRPRPPTPSRSASRSQLFDDDADASTARSSPRKSKNSYFFVFLAANSTQNLGNVPETRHRRASSSRRAARRRPTSRSTPRWRHDLTARSRNSPIPP